MKQRTLLRFSGWPVGRKRAGGRAERYQRPSRPNRPNRPNRWLSRQQVMLALCALALSACMMPGPPDTTLFESPDCTESNNLGLDGIRPAVPVDAMQLRQRNLSGPPVILTSSGNECATATDPSACEMKLAAASTAPGFHPCPGNACGRSLATTTGDTVTSYTDSKALTAFLGPIDTPMDAVLFVYAQGYNVSCIDKSIGSVRAALDGDGYEVLASLPELGCNPLLVTGYQLRVTSRGGFTYLSRWPVQLPPGIPCE